MRLLRSSFSSAIYYGGRIAGKKAKGVRILCYHRVNDFDTSYTTISISNFQKQMEFLSTKGYQTISLNELLSRNSNGALSPKEIVITFDDGWRDNYECAFPILKRFGFKATIFLIADQVGQPDYLTREQILEMSQYGIQFGSHTLSHPNLKTLTEEQKWNEIFVSRKKLEDQFKFNVDFFCYPYGLYDSKDKNLVTKAGYLGACSNIPGANIPSPFPSPSGRGQGEGGKTSFELRRTEIGAHDTIFDFEKKIAGAYDLLHQGLHWLRGRP